MMSRYVVNIGEREYDVQLKRLAGRYEVIINGTKIEVSCNRLGGSRSLLLIDGQTQEVDVHSNSFDSHRTVFMRGHEIPVRIESYDMLRLRKAVGFKSVEKGKKEIKAPMPGMVLEVRVKPGDRVQTGQPILVIEAMKMENVIKADGDGLVTSVTVKAGQSVEKGDLLVGFE